MRSFWRDKILFENKSKDMPVQVIERDDRRELRFGNYITQSSMSLSSPDVLQLDYTRAMMAAFVFAPQAANILHLGLGAGSLARFIHLHFPKSRQILVELNPAVIQAAYNFFFLPVSPRLEVTQNDGREFLDSCKSQFDLIFQDAFHAEGVSRHLESKAFFTDIRDHLAPQGWLINNVWGSDRANLNLVRENLTAIFPQLYSLSVRAESNVIFFAGVSGNTPSPALMRDHANKLSHDMGIDISRLAQSIQAIRGSADGAVPATG